MSIAPITLPTPPVAERVEQVRTTEAPAGNPVEFGGVFADALGQATALEKTSADMANRFAAGDPSVGIHEVMIASEESGIALRFMTTLRTKALDAYRELMSTQV